MNNARYHLRLVAQKTFHLEILWNFGNMNVRAPCVSSACQMRSLKANGTDLCPDFVPNIIRKNSAILTLLSPQTSQVLSKVCNRRCLTAVPRLTFERPGYGNYTTCYFWATAMSVFPCFVAHFALGWLCEVFWSGQGKLHCLWHFQLANFQWGGWFVSDFLLWWHWKMTFINHFQKQFPTFL